MVLRYATNLKLAKELYDASKPKLKGDQGMINTFTNTFGLPENSVKLAGGVEAVAAGLFAASFLNKNISRLGSLAAISVLGVAAYKHFNKCFLSIFQVTVILNSTKLYLLIE